MFKTGSRGLEGLAEPVNLLLLEPSLMWLVEPPNRLIPVVAGLNRPNSAGLMLSRSLNVFGNVWFEIELEAAVTRGWLGIAEPPDSNLLRTRLTFPVQTGDGDRRRIDVDDGGGAGDTGLGLFVAFRNVVNVVNDVDVEAGDAGFGGFRILATGSWRTSCTGSVLISNL